jgi:ribosomal protein S18 acetylase RimI-like enzyme
MTLKFSDNSIWIRRAKPDDVNQIADLVLDLYKVHSRLEEAYRIKSDAVCLNHIKKDLRKYFKRPKTRTILVCENDKKIIGFADFWIERRNCYVYDKAIWIYEIHVDKNYRRKGAATRLIKEIARIAKRKGIKEIDLTCVPKNKESSKFWRSLKARTISVNAITNIKDIL